MKKKETKIEKDEHTGRSEYLEQKLRFKKTMDQLDNLSDKNLSHIEMDEKVKNKKIFEEQKRNEKKILFEEKTKEINLEEIDEFNKRKDFENKYNKKRKLELKKREISYRNKSILG